MRLLPHDPSQGWTPYAWLIYLAVLLVPGLTGPFTLAAWLATGASVLVFLPLYFWSYWLKGRRLLWLGLAMFALGLLLAPLNPFSTTYIIYAGAAVGRLGSNRWVVGSLAAFLVALAVATWAMRLGWWFFAPAALFMVFVGGVNAHFSEVHRAQALLHASRKENERLAQIAERERIARDLHDLLGHTLSMITLKAELAGRLLGSNPERAAVEVAEVERIAREAMREVRSAVSGYRSEGLAAELARARLALESAGIRAEYFIVPVELTPAVGNALALALREAVTNLVRHAAATSCNISLESHGELACLEVRDDGRGGPFVAGTGLSAMRERVTGVGGTVEVLPADPSSSSRAGTRLIVRVPLGRKGSVPAEEVAATVVEGHGLPAWAGGRPS
jgi:two-component system, NarL family, sensor histidine kinase DesK